MAGDSFGGTAEPSDRPMAGKKAGRHSLGRLTAVPASERSPMPAGRCSNLFSPFGFRAA